ncbi:MAG: tail fiber domain-containing protein [Oleispira sp.]
MGWFTDTLAKVDPTTKEGLGNIASIATLGSSDLISKGGDWVDDNLLGGNEEDATKEAAKLAVEGQQNELAYLQEINKIPQAFLEQSMQQFGGYYGIGYDPETGQATQIEPTMPSQEERIGLAESSPLYASIMGGQQAGEEAIARSASATSGLRGGGTASQLAGFGKDLKNEALMTSYNDQLRQEQQKQQGLGTLMGQQTYGSQIGQTMSGIGSTLAQGKIAGAQARSDAMGQVIGAGGQVGSSIVMSDMRLKENINQIGDTSHPDINMYEWDWLAISGKSGMEDGFLAQEVEKVWPDLVIEGDDGYKRILKTEIENRLKELN